MTSTTPERRSAKAVFTAAMGVSDPAERHAYVEAQCANDTALRQQVAGLLAAAEASVGDNPLDAMVEAFGPESTANAATVLPTPRVVSQRREIGRYKLLEQIGEGAFGTVYMARQSAPLRRNVAIKVLKPGMDSREILARFEAERQALAMMDHPNIARVLDAGSTAKGRPYFVMELVRGTSVTDYCDEARLTTDERLELFVDICRAVQHAHQKGIIHRDLKPSNVLVTMHDDKAVPKVIDFGIAKALSQQLTDRTLITGYRQMLGTPLYMSPEQTQMSGIDVDTRSDVYSLGVLLYELLTGTTPFDRKSLRNASYDDLRRIIREQEPPRPSTRLTTLNAAARSTVADRRKVDQRKFSAELRGELDWIVMKALEKDRSRRYQSATALAEDVQRYLNDEAVEACPPSVGYRLRKYSRRYKGLLTTSLLVAMSLLIGTGVSLREAYKASSALRLADEHFRLARKAVDEMYIQVAEAWLGNDKELTRVQTEFLEKALAYYVTFADDASADVESTVASIAGIVRAASIQNKLGRLAEATASYRQAIDRCKDLQQMHPDHAGLVLTQIDVYCKFADVRAFEWQIDDISRAVQAAYAAFERVDMSRVVDARPTAEWDPILRKLASNLVTDGNQTEAKVVANLVLKQWTSIVERAPNDWDARFGLGRAYSTFGTVHLWWGDANPQSETAFRKALAIYEQLIAERPDEPTLRSPYSKVLQSLAVLCSRDGRTPEDLQFSRRALEVNREVFRTDPTDSVVAVSMIGQIGNLLKALRTVGSSENQQEAVALAHEQFAIASDLLDRHPGVKAYEFEFVRGLERLVRTLLTCDGADAVSQAFTSEHLAKLTSLSGWTTVYIDAPALSDYGLQLLGSVATAHIARGDHRAAKKCLDTAPEGMTRFPQEFPIVVDPDEYQEFLGNLEQIESFCVSAHRPVILYQDCLELVQADPELNEVERQTLIDQIHQRIQIFREVSEQAAAAWFQRLIESKHFYEGFVMQKCEIFIKGAAQNQGSPLLQRVHRRAKLFLCREMIRQSVDLLDRYPFEVCTVGYLTAGPEELRDVDLALQFASEAVRLRPGGETELQQMAWVQFRQGRWQECFDTLDSLTEKTLPVESDALRAMCLWQLGRHDEAVTYIDDEHGQRLQEFTRKLEDGRKRGTLIYPNAAMLLQLRREAEEMIHGTASFSAATDVEQIQ